LMRHQAPVYHIGRGGAGNFGASGSGADDGVDSLAEQRDSAGSSRSDSSMRSVSSGEGVAQSMGEARRSLDRTWSRLRGSFAK
jgi:hypothetical protein